METSNEPQVQAEVTMVDRRASSVKSRDVEYHMLSVQRRMFGRNNYVAVSQSSST